MLNTALIPDKTVLSAKGDGAPVELNGLSSRTLLLTLNITEIVEQESLEISIFGSADGQTWTPKALMSFPQKFYKGEYPLLLDLTDEPEITSIRAHWEVNRWGRGTDAPMFEVSLGAREVPANVLRETAKAQK